MSISPKLCRHTACSALVVSGDAIGSRAFLRSASAAASAVASAASASGISPKSSAEEIPGLRELLQ